MDEGTSSVWLKLNGKTKPRELHGRSVPTTAGPILGTILGMRHGSDHLVTDERGVMPKSGGCIGRVLADVKGHSVWSARLRFPMMKKL